MPIRSRRRRPPIEVLIVDDGNVRRLLPMRECIGLMEEALAALARGQAALPLRSIVWLPEKKGALGLMPAFLGPQEALGVKAVTFFPQNEGTELDSHQGAVLLFDVATGALSAVIDATSITAIRTAAVSAVATKLLARQDARELAIVGSGVQAKTHLEAMVLVRDFRRVRVASKTVERARAFAERESRRYGLSIEPVGSVEAAIRGADVVCTVTSSREPVLRGEWLASGAHVNAVGSSVPFARELDTAAVARSRLYVDRRESTLNEAGDFLIPKREGAIGDDHIVAEVGEVLIGAARGRGTRDEITLFKSLGLAIEDVACARSIADKAARERGVPRLEIGGRRHEAD